MVEQRPVKAMVAGSSPAEAANLLQYPNMAEEMDPESIKYRFESCVEHQFYPVRPKQRTRSYGLRNVGWIPTRDTMIFSSNGRIPDF